MSVIEVAIGAAREQGRNRVEVVRSPDGEASAVGGEVAAREQLPRSVRHKDLPAVTRLFGIRHHGPGSARSLREGLAGLEPDVVLIEGPPEADALVDLARDPQMQPPVALL